MTTKNEIIEFDFGLVYCHDSDEDKEEEKQRLYEELETYKADLGRVKRVLDSENKVVKDKSKILNSLKEEYPTFFDEESGNETDKEGLKQVQDYIQEEIDNSEKLLDDIRKQAEAEAEAEAQAQAEAENTAEDSFDYMDID